MRRQERGRFGLLALIGILIAGGPLGTDTYLPALPEVARELDTTAALAANTLTVYLIGLGAGQFIWGPISDRIGRRRPLLIGLTLFIAAALVCAAAPSIWVLLAARLVMGGAGSSMVVLGRAVVRDLYSGPRLSKIFGRLAIVFGIAPVVGPLFGGAILLFSDWRGTFVALAILGAVLLGCSLLIVRETLDDEHRVHGRSAERREAWLAPVRNQWFLLNTVILVGSTTAMLTYITFVSFVMQTERGVPQTLFAVLFAASAVMVMVGGQLGPVLATRYGASRVMRASLAVFCGSALVVALISALGWPTWLLYAFLILNVLQASILQPLSLAEALVPFARGAGTAAALAGGSQMIVGSLVPGIVAELFGERGVVLGISQAVVTGLTLLVATIWARAAASRDWQPARGPLA